jgi:hypothetical protein
MPKYMTVHRAPGLLREQWAENAVSIRVLEEVRFHQAYVNLGSGFLFTIFEAPDQDTLIDKFEELGFPYEEIHELQFSQSFAEMEQMLQQMERAP